MVIEVAKHNASIVDVGPSVIACSNITEAFLDVFNIDYGKDFAIIKQAHTYINNNPIIKVDVVVKDQLYKDVEFILIKSEQQGIFINENSLVDGILIEQHQLQEIAEEDATVVDCIAEQMAAVVDNVVVDESTTIDVVDLKQQAKLQQQNKIAQHLHTIQEELSDQVSFELQQTKQSILTEALNLQNKLQQDGIELVQQSIEMFRQQLRDWALSTEHHLTAYAEEAIADVEHQWTEKCVQLLDENKEKSLQHLQQDISIATINSMAAIKEKLSVEIANHLKMVDESNAKKDADIDAFVQMQISQLHGQIEQSQMQKFDAKVAELLIKQHDWLQQNINETTDAYDEKVGQMSNEINKVVAAASTDVVDCIKNADATIAEKIQNALQQLDATAQQLHEQRMQSIEQSVAQVLKDNIAEEQTDVISEARSSARNAVRDALASYKSDVSKDLNAQLMNIQKELHAKMQIYIQSYGGGGSVAMQFADGGTMNGTLNVSNGQILSAGVDLADIFSQSSGGSQTLSFNESTAQLTIAPNGNTVSLSALSGGGAIAAGNYLPLSGGTIAGSVTITNTLSTTTLYATSAYMTIIDITQYELSGFNVTGDVTVNGTLSSSQIIYADSGNSNKWSSVYSTVNANSATTWNYQGADVKALTANWQGTYSTVNTNSAAWGIDNTTDAEVRALTANWQSTYSTVQTNSAGWIQTLVFDESNAQLSISGGNTISLSSLDGGYADRLVNGSYQVMLSSDGIVNIPGTLTVPNLTGGKIITASPFDDISSFYGLTGIPVSQNGVDGTIDISSVGVVTVSNQGKNYTDGVAIIGGGTRILITTTLYGWIFSPDGSITFPDNTIQTTAFIAGEPLFTTWAQTYSANYDSTYTTVNANSASWGGGSTIDTGVRALTSNWQNTYTSFSTQSANNISTYTTVNANSASWGASTGVSYLSALNDVSIPAPVNGQVLTYNAILNKWTAGTPLSATGATGYYGSFYDERNQNATSPTSAYTVSMSGTFESNGISLSSNNIIFQYAGTYEIIYSLQIENSHNAQEDVQVWFTKNGANIPNSNSVFTVHAKTGNITGKIVMVTPFITTVNAGDAIGIKWAAADTGVSIVSLPPNTTPTTPAAPGVIFTVKQVTNVQVPGSITSNYLPLSGGTLTGTVSTNSDIEITDSTKGIILRSPSSFKYRVTVSDAGELITTLV
jgi:hypothetical protein